MKLGVVTLVMITLLRPRQDHKLETSVSNIARPFLKKHITKHIF